MKLALGTVQFGQSYGIANTEGQIDINAILSILKLAKENNVNTLDTAILYGNSEQRLGECGVEDWRIVTKLPPIPKQCMNVEQWILEQVEGSLFRLNTNSILGLMLHSPLQLLEKNGSIVWGTLTELKSRGIIEKIGYSVYQPKELDLLWSEFRPDIIQAPYNILDRRLKSSGWLDKLVNNEIEVHVRSIFLQGLLLMSKENRPAKFDQWNKLWDLWDNWLQEQGVSAIEACLKFVLSEKGIDFSVIGIDSKKQFDEILSVVRNQKSDFLIPDILSISDEKLINPGNW